MASGESPINGLFYLINRNEFESINGFNTALANIICGVSQGSILGPLLFLVYINNFTLCS